MFHHWVTVGSISLNHCAGRAFEEWQQPSQDTKVITAAATFSAGPYAWENAAFRNVQRIFANLKSIRCHQTPALADDSGIKCSSSPELSTEACYWGGQLHPYSSIMIKAGCVALLASAVPLKDLCCCFFSSADRTSHS